MEEKIEELIQKHTVALTKTGDKDFDPPEVVSFDTRVINSFELKNDLLDLIASIRREEITENTSDGYHTFKELYEFRKLYNALIFNEWAKQGKYNVHKSKKHNDGEDCFGGGWFIVMADLPTGQISNHYELKDWDLFKCKEREKADKWDGHTAQEVSERILASLKEE